MSDSERGRGRDGLQTMWAVLLAIAVIAVSAGLMFYAGLWSVFRFVLATSVLPSACAPLPLAPLIDIAYVTGIWALVCLVGLLQRARNRRSRISLFVGDCLLGAVGLSVAVGGTFWVFILQPESNPIAVYFCLIAPMLMYFIARFPGYRMPLAPARRFWAGTGVAALLGLISVGAALFSIRGFVCAG